MIIVYDKRDGKILCKASNVPEPLMLYHHYPQEFKDNLAWLFIDKFTK